MQRLVQAISKKDRMSIGMEGGKTNCVEKICEVAEKQQNNDPSIVHTRFTCATVNVWNETEGLEREDQGPTRAGQDAVSCLL
jgi:hypothetical protein